MNTIPTTLLIALIYTLIYFGGKIFIMDYNLKVKENIKDTFSILSNSLLFFVWINTFINNEWYLYLLNIIASVILGFCYTIAQKVFSKKFI